MGRSLKRSHATGVVSLAALLVSACGGGGGDPAESSASAPSAAPTPSVNRIDAARLAQQATFGPTQELVDHIVSMGLAGWIDEQFAATGSNYTDLLALSVTRDYCTVNAPNDGGVCSNRYYNSPPVAARFYADAAGNPDQLRQRVAFALSQLMVASTAEVSSSAGLASLNQIFLGEAFGNYHDILKAVTLNAFMGDYLDMVDSSRNAPSENYAREFMQLFTMGPDALNMDGSLKRDSSGGTIANYTPDDIKGVARALTGWTYAHLNGGAVGDYNTRDYAVPMIQISARYDTAAKSFLGSIVPAGASQDASVQAVVDAAFNNASTPPFVARFLIRNLVTSNPSAAYVGRVAAVFADNGAGVRGDLKAVVKAILMDNDARGAVRTGAADGKVKEPVLLMTALARAVGITTDGYAFVQRESVLGQPVFRAPSVFNFYPPNYPLPQSTTLVSPASKLITSGYVVQRHNFIYDWTLNGENRYEFPAQANVPGSTGTSLAWTNWQSIGGDVDALIERVNSLLLADAMTAAQRSALRQALVTVTNSDPAIQARRRAELAFYVVATSPQFQVDR